MQLYNICDNKHLKIHSRPKQSLPVFENMLGTTMTNASPKRFSFQNKSIVTERTPYSIELWRLRQHVAAQTQSGLCSMLMFHFPEIKGW